MLASQRSGRHNARCSNTDELLITNEFRLRSLAAAPENTGARAAVGRRGRRRMISEGATNAHRGAPASELLNVRRHRVPAKCWPSRDREPKTNRHELPRGIGRRVV
jgi:hypothetical protein